jgi:hypothetical protein
MVASAHESPHRLVVAPGEIVLCDTRLVRIEARLSKSLARVRDLATGQREDVPLTDLRGRAVLTDSVQTDQSTSSPPAPAVWVRRISPPAASRSSANCLTAPETGRPASTLPRPSTACLAEQSIGGFLDIEMSQRCRR